MTEIPLDFNEWFDDFQQLVNKHYGAFVRLDKAIAEEMYNDGMTPEQALAESIVEQDGYL